MVKRLLIFFGIVFALVALVWGITLLFSREPDSISNVNSVQTPINAPIVDPGLLPTTAPVNANVMLDIVPKRLSEEEYSQREAEQFVKEFAARFGTYSNQNFGSNVAELLPYTSGDAMIYLQKLHNQYQELKNDYVGMTSMAVALNWDAFDPRSNQYRARVGMYRVETRGNEEYTFNQELDISLVKQESNWKVVEVSWVPVQ